MRLIRLAASLMLVASAAGADAASNEGSVVADGLMPSIPRTVQRVSTGPLGEIWRLKEMEPVRALVEEQAAALRTRLGVDLLDVLSDVSELRSRTLLCQGRPVTELSMRLPTRAADLAALAAQFGTAAGDETVVNIPLPQAKIGRIRRADDWVVYTDATAEDVLPAGPPPTVAADADSAGFYDLAPLLGLAGPEGEAVGRTLGAGRVLYEQAVTASGSRDSFRLIGLRLPLAPLDPAVLAGLPDRPLALFAVGLDGPATTDLIDELLAALQITPTDLTAELRAAISGSTGTALLAVYPSAPFPTVTAAFPASAALDAVLASWAEEAELDLDLAAAHQEAQMLPLPRGFPFMVQVRRTVGHWWISTDAARFDGITSGSSGALDAAKLLEGGDGALGVASQDLGGLAQFTLGMLPMMQAGLVQIQQAQGRRGGVDNSAPMKRWFAVGQRALAAAIPMLTKLPCRGLLVRQGADLELRGDNAAAVVMLPAVMAGILLPAITLVRENAQRTKSGNNMRQIVTALIADMGEREDGGWPADLDGPLERMQMPEELLVSPGAKDVPQPHYLYVRPIAETPSSQPVLVENPACRRGRGAMVARVDGSVSYLAGSAAHQVWAEAQRLAALPQAAAAGIAPADWAAVAETLGMPAPEPAEMVVEPAF
ncbi:MAG: hypothetical protein H0W72_12045 [Planctomycetes bacterium]|nr:hypothetical protein [Planctomycetota bacterium]